MLGFAIRRICNTDRDIELVASLFDQYRQFYDQPADPEGARAFIRERLAQAESVIFGAEPNVMPAAASSRLWGFVQLYPSFSSVAAARIWIVNDLFVVRRARGAGIGRALLERARRHAIATRARRLILETRAWNVPAQSLFEAVGYVCDNSEVRFYTLDLP